MCGIIGYSNNNVTLKDLLTLEKVMRESQIRGKHASGVAWYDGEGIQTYIKPIPIGKLVDEFDLSRMVVGKSITMIAHARYSTSDIKYNQPIVVGNAAIAHNGVITQEAPETWEKTYGVKCITRNDSELLLRCMTGEIKEDLTAGKASVAAVMITSDGAFHYVRNGLRPMWCGKIGDGEVFASTYDILHRAGVEDIQKVLPISEEYQNRSSDYGKRISYKQYQAIS